MGIKNYLIEGGSGTGKTSVATELERRGYHVVHGDRVLAYVGDPETGQALAGPPEGADRIVWGYAHWIWRVDKVHAIAADTTHPATFFCGGSRNFHKFLDLFDKVFVLDIDVETLNRRLDGRPNEPGFEPAERALVLHYHHTREYLPIGISIDTTATVPSVVDDILAQLT
ncbi:nucleoside kinase [Rhizobium leguminosarum bv. trifolii]|uniref:nucleoside kinase n=1 Tax=Rhizobium ruizarguesonis TaxID=2081791 RepID=UPI00103061CA|nr:nucleoside kinase [Rhizobium ruizarguesonis]QIO44588.1 nucleoside kinase [Rhizobium leguminosarum bv. trifolii]TAY20543.1 nucleoside kinase [Rhizobium ruizarguesonis]TCA84642.1 nucleoside kinase [Rhizobium leguminosarum bv. viciae]